MNDTEVSLRQYVETLMGQYERHHAREHELLAESVDHARTTLDVRLESMNHIQKQINEERGRMVLRDVYDSQHEALRQKVEELQKANARMVGIGAGVVAVLLALEFLFEFVVK